MTIVRTDAKTIKVIKARQHRLKGFDLEDLTGSDHRTAREIVHAKILNDFVTRQTGGLACDYAVGCRWPRTLMRKKKN